MKQEGEGEAVIGRIRLRRISDVTKASLHGFIAEAVEPGSTVQTDGLNAYLGLEGYIHDRHVLCHQSEGDTYCPGTPSHLAAEAMVAGHPIAVPRRLFAAILERIGRLGIPTAVCRSG